MSEASFEAIFLSEKGICLDQNQTAKKMFGYHLSGKEDKIVMADHLHDSVLSYREFFYEQERSGDIEAIREAAQQGKAWGRAVFLERLGSKLGRVVVPRKRGRSKKEEK